MFQQFCRTREPAVLGAIFDATADDLFSLALHLTRDHAMAEDVLQATFLVVIERADRWQTDRPLRPWLLGILHREVRVARRRARRAPQPGRLATRSSDAPDGAVLAAEVRTAVRAALDGVPEPYRQVIDLHLLQELAPAAIAARLQRRSGSVRTQLWRGLELLRQRLPQGLALGLVASLTAKAPLAAVRQRVVAAAADAGAVPVAAVLILGGMVKKVLTVAVLLVVGLLVVANGAWDATMRPLDARDEALGPAASAMPGAVPSADGREPAVARREPTAAAGPAGTPPIAADSPPFEVLARVLDLRGAAIADAEVEVLVPKVAVLPTGQRVSPRDRSACVVRELLNTDAEGRVRLTLAGPALLSARKPGMGWSGDRLVGPDGPRRWGELLLVLQPTGTLRGLVLQADGQPAVGASVEARLPYSQEIVGLPPAKTDAEGRFEFECLAGAKSVFDYQVLALLGVAHSRPQQVALAAGAVHEIVLRFFGEFVVRGLLVDERGAPSAGRVFVAGLPGTATAEAAVHGECGEDGRFEYALDLAGEYLVVAGRAGKAPALAAFEVGAARPAANVSLRMQVPLATRGRLVDQQGAPLAGRTVSIVPEWSAALSEPAGTADLLLRLHRDAFSGPLQATSDADGRFAVMLPPGWRCRAITPALPESSELWVRSESFLAPSDAVTLVVRTQDTLGFVLAGRVLDDATGLPVQEVGIERRTGAGHSGSLQHVGRARDGSFRVGPLAPNGRCWFVFTAEGQARTLVGPFDAGVRTETVTVRMPRLGRVRCRVLRADGTPAASAFVVLQREVEDPFAPAWQGATDQNGWRTFEDVEPVALQARAWASRQAALLQVVPASLPVVVRAGQDSEIVVVLAH